MKHTILIVDDDRDILNFLSYNIKKEGFNVFTAENGKVALDTLHHIKPSLILLDVMMPVMDGMEACQLIREKSAGEQPIIAFLTSRAEDYSQIAGFQAGADDYITKPIRPRLLNAKIKSLILRYEKSNDSIADEKETLPIRINREKFTVEFEQSVYNLPKKEFELLELLLSRPGHVFTRDQILTMVWGDDVIVGDRTVDVHIRKLRERFGNETIKTIKGVGYKFYSN